VAPVAVAAEVEVRRPRRERHVAARVVERCVGRVLVRLHVAVPTLARTSTLVCMFRTYTSSLLFVSPASRGRAW
jgi:hypothetical protein